MIPYAEPRGVAELKHARVQRSAVLDSRDAAEQPGHPEDSATCGPRQAAFTGNYLVLYSCFPLNRLNHFLPRKSSTLAFRGPATQLHSYSVDI